MTHLFAPMRFVRSEEELLNSATIGNSIEESSKSTKSQLSTGQEVRSFYVSLFSTCDTCSLSSIECNCTKDYLMTDEGTPKTEKRLTRSMKSKKLSNLESADLRNRFLKYSSDGNLQEIRNCLQTDSSILNYVDEFGLSALMCAAYEGHTEVVKFLLFQGADYSLTNKQNRTVLNIARRRGHKEIVSLILMAIDGQLQEENTSSMDSNLDVVEEFYCDICGANFRDSTHETSTVHLLKLSSLSKENGDGQKPTYLLPETNRGFQLMLKEGWDSRTGLGREGRGRWYPVKTILKRDRLGLGSRKGPKPRITHFAPHDVKAIQKIKNGERKVKLQIETKKDRARREAEVKEKIKNFRRLFY